MQQVYSCMRRSSHRVLDINISIFYASDYQGETAVIQVYHKMGEEA